MTNADVIRSMSDEQLAYLLASETHRIGKVVFDAVGFGVTEEFLYFLRLKWLKEEVKTSEEQ